MLPQTVVVDTFLNEDCGSSWHSGSLSSVSITEVLLLMLPLGLDTAISMRSSRK